METDDRGIISEAEQDRLSNAVQTEQQEEQGWHAFIADHYEKIIVVLLQAQHEQDVAVVREASLEAPADMVGNGDYIMGGLDKKHTILAALKAVC